MDMQDWQIRFFAARMETTNASEQSEKRKRDNLDLFLFPGDKIFSSHPLSANR